VVHSSSPDVISFAKYHGNGNDFIIIEIDTSDKLERFLEKAILWCDRHKGIGADGVLLIEFHEGLIKLTVINADGSLAQNCGNGLRCVARYFFDKNPKKSELSILLSGQSYSCKKVENQIEVSMGVCELVFLKEHFFTHKKQSAQIFKGSFGNEHLIFLFEGAPLNDETSLIDEIKEHFPNWHQFNVGLSFLNDNIIFSLVLERGVGLTQSCGSGACAAFAAALFRYRTLPDSLKVKQPGGSLEVRATTLERCGFHAKYEMLLLGTAEPVFFGNWIKDAADIFAMLT
jgi:diaminopimelate epimerase